MERLIEEFKRKMFLDGKSQRTMEVYSNSVKEFFGWFYGSYGDVEFKKLYRENILEYKSYLKNVKKSLHSGNNLCTKTINSKLSALICFNELIQPDDIVVSKRDLIKIQPEIVSPTSITKKEVEEFRQIVLQTIRKSFDGMHLKEDAVKPVLEEYGAERLRFILANTVKENEWDARFSRDNVTWAMNFFTAGNMPYDAPRNVSLSVGSHPAVLNGFIDLFRREVLEQETELAFQIADRYISIQETEGGYDYSIMGEDYKEIDGGVYDNPDVSIREALNDIVEDLKENPHDNGARGNIRENDELIPIDYNELIEKVEEADHIESQVDVVADFRAKTNELFHEISEMNPAEIEERECLGG